MGNVLLFVGDSITDAGRREAGRDPLGHGYVADLAPRIAMHTGWTALNAGIAGDRIRDIRARWESDVENVRPDGVSLLVGINDVWRRFSDDDPTSASAFEADYRAVLERRRISGDAPLILGEPFLIPFRPGQEEWVGDLNEKREIVRALAVEFRATFVPLHAELTRDAATVGAAALTTDGVHLTPAGHRRVGTHWRAHAMNAFSG